MKEKDPRFKKYKYDNIFEEGIDLKAQEEARQLIEEYQAGFLNESVGRIVEARMGIDPFPWQQAVLDENQANDIFAGGARGPGKSMLLAIAGIIYAQRWAGAKMCMLGLRTETILQNVFDKIKQIFPEMVEGQRMWSWNSKRRILTFRNGSFIYFGHAKSKGEVMEQIHGQSYAFIGLDDAGQFSPDILDYVPSCNRLNVNLEMLQKKTGVTIPILQLVTGNPLGLAHIYLKEKYVDTWVKYCKGKGPVDENGEPTNLHTWKVPVINPKTKKQAVDKKGNPAYQVISYYPANVEDNPSYKDDVYHWQLMALPERLRKAYLEGSWDIAMGGMFSEFRDEIHVSDYIEMQPGWRKKVSLDFGFSDGFGVIYVQQDPLTKLWQAFDESSGRELEFDDLAKLIYDKSIREGFYDDIEEAILVWDMFNQAKRGFYTKNGKMGDSKADAFEKITGIPAKSSGKPGRKEKWEHLHKALKVRDSSDEKEQNPVYIQKTIIAFAPKCYSLIKQVKFTQVDISKPGDIIPMKDENGIKYDHTLDALAAFAWVEIETEQLNTWTHSNGKRTFQDIVLGKKENYIDKFFREKQEAENGSSDVNILRTARGLH